MTTITIKEELATPIINCDTALETVEVLLENMGYVMLQPVEDKAILERLQRHKAQNKNRDISSFDNI